MPRAGGLARGRVLAALGFGEDHTVGASTGRYGAGFLAGVENLTRYLGIGSGRSKGKEALNRCASKLVGKLTDAQTAGHNRKAALRFRGRLITIRNRVESYKQGKYIGRAARSGAASRGQIRAFIRQVYGRYRKGSKLREAFRRGYRDGSR